MAALTKDILRSLASFKSSGPPVVSLYLDVDGHRYVRARDYQAELAALVRSAAAQPTADLARIEDFVNQGVDRSQTRGLAIFSCAEEGFWQVVELPVPVHNRLTVNQAPQVRQLEAVLDNNERFGVLLVDRQRARLFAFELGQLVERREWFDELPRHEDDKGEWDRDHVHDHVASAVRAHIRRVAQAVFAADRSQPFDHVILGGPTDVVADLERELHPYLRDRVAARVSIAVGAKDEEVRQAALNVELDVNRDKADHLVRKALDHANGSANGAAVGLRSVLAALGERRADHLLVSEGYSTEGWHCPACDRLETVGPRCDLCGGAMARVADVVDEAIALALQQRCRVTTCAASADLDVAGRIAALCRF